MSDNKYINPETLLQYCNTNEAFLEKKVRGIVLEFPGLGGGSCLGGLMDLMSYDTPYTRQFAEAGLVVAYTFPGPWSWMNKGAVRMADLIVDALREKYQLSEDSPLIATGGSMGGLGALIYTASSRHKVTACAAACPCYDLTTCYDVVPHFARTVVSAISAYDMPLDDAIKTISPLYRLDDMPRIPYFIVCDEEDNLFPADGMRAYAEKLEEKTGRKVIYHSLPGQPHGGFTPEVRQALNDFVIDNAK